MGIGGINHKLTELDISDALQQNRGVISQAAIELGISRQHLNVLMRQYPAVMEQLPKWRNNFEENLLDSAEATVQYCMNMRKEKTAIALRAATYVLDKRGEARGWLPTQSPVDPKSTEKLDDVLALLKQVQDASDAKIAESNNMSETKSEWVTGEDNA
jgi:hypothetical protein